MANMREMGYVNVDDIEFDVLIKKLKDAYFKKMSGQLLEEEDKELLREWEM